jgi:hypothetical protein
VRVLHAFSETLGEGVSLVGNEPIRDPLFSYPFPRHSLPRKRSLRESAFFSPCVSFVELLCGPL